LKRLPAAKRRSIQKLQSQLERLRSAPPTQAPVRSLGDKANANSSVEFWTPVSPPLTAHQALADFHFEALEFDLDHESGQLNSNSEEERNTDAESLQSSEGEQLGLANDRPYWPLRHASYSSDSDDEDATRLEDGTAEAKDLVADAKAHGDYLPSRIR
jgi:hypothetical protein